MLETPAETTFIKVVARNLTTATDVVVFLEPQSLEKAEQYLAPLTAGDTPMASPGEEVWRQYAYGATEDSRQRLVRQWVGDNAPADVTQGWTLP